MNAIEVVFSILLGGVAVMFLHVARWAVCRGRLRKCLQTDAQDALFCAFCMIVFVVVSLSASRLWAS